MLIDQIAGRKRERERENSLPNLRHLLAGRKAGKQVAFKSTLFMANSKAQSQLKCQEADVDFKLSLLLLLLLLPPSSLYTLHAVFQSSSTHTHQQQTPSHTHTHTHREMVTNLFSSQLARKGLIVSQSAKVAHTHTHPHLSIQVSIDSA